MSTKTAVVWVSAWCAFALGMFLGFRFGQFAESGAGQLSAGIAALVSALLCIVGALAHELHRRKPPAA